MAQHKKFAFGDFNFDCSSGLLSRNGKLLRIPDQAARLLTLLLEAQGELVTREQIRDGLWPDGEFLDHNHSINKAISQLRAILRDSVQNPKYLSTIPKRGYRFLKVVQLSDPTEDSAPIVHHSRISAQEEAASVLPADNAIFAPETSLRSSRQKGIKQLAVYLIVLIIILGVGGAYFYRHNQQRPAHTITLAIVPFELKSDGEQELSESLRMDMTDAISQLPGVQVRAAHSIPIISVTPEAVRDTARIVQAEILLYGHLTLNKDHFSFELEMIRGDDAAHLASFRYAGSRAEMMSLRTKVQRDLFSQLALAGHGQQHALGSTNNAKAYELYLYGRSLLEQHTVDALRKAFNVFQQAADSDPHFAGAYAGMAHAEMQLAEQEAVPPAQGYQIVRKLGMQALSEAPSLAEAHALLGFSAFRLDWNYNEAENELKRSIDFDPNVAVYHIWYSVLLADEGRFEESFQQIDLAHSIEPFWAPIYITDMFLSSSAHRYDRMLNDGHKLLEMKPDWPLAHDQEAWALWYNNQSEEAIQEWMKMAQIEKDTARIEFERQGLLTFHEGGRKAYAQLRAKACTKPIAAAHPNDFIEGEWNAYAGNKEKTYSFLEHQVASHSEYALEIPVIPCYLSLHSEGRFKEIEMRIGLPLPRKSNSEKQ